MAQGRDDVGMCGLARGTILAADERLAAPYLGQFQAHPPQALDHMDDRLVARCGGDRHVKFAVDRADLFLALAVVGHQGEQFVELCERFSRDRRRSNSERSEEHTSELQSLMRTSYAVFCLKTKKNNKLLNTQHKTSP